jgi:acetyl-CoA carboxylase biotin carboxyl carrier protein
MNEKEIRRLIKIVEETEISELEVKKWFGHRIRIVKNGALNATPQPVYGGTVVEAAQKQTEKQPAEEPEVDYHVAKSPMVGTFYRAPAPDEAPFVSVGDNVRVGQTLCIIEAMKVMNEIEAEVSGLVKEILVDNAQSVEYNQPIFHIEENK